MASCRACGAALGAPFLALGDTPISNAYLRADQLAAPEPRFPLDVSWCERCGLVQLAALHDREAHFGESYPYFASFSDSWLAHSRAYAEQAIRRFALGPASLVVEAASNDGYLLQYFHARGVPVRGVEPSRSVAEAALAKGIATDVTFFGADYAAAMPGRADLVIANNVLAHVPDLADFVAGIARALLPHGVATLEFPHLLRTLEGNQFDTIYHEHYSYLALRAVVPLFLRHGLEVFDVDELATHGGSLRVYAQLAGGGRPVEPAVAAVARAELAAGLDRAGTYARFAARVRETQRALVELLREARRSGLRVAGYGAPAKGNTLLVTCGVTRELVAYTVDRSPHKQGKFLPGSHLPIHAPEYLLADRPDAVLILPWNLEAEITAQLSAIRTWGGRFVVPIPAPRFA